MISYARNLLLTSYPSKILVNSSNLINGYKSKTIVSTSGVQQGSILDQLLFDVHINDIGDYNSTSIVC